MTRWIVSCAVLLTVAAACGDELPGLSEKERQQLSAALAEAGSEGIVTPYYPCDFATGLLLMTDESGDDESWLGWRVIDADTAHLDVGDSIVAFFQVVNCQERDVLLLKEELASVGADPGVHSWPWLLRGIHHMVESTDTGESHSRYAIGDADYWETEIHFSESANGSYALYSDDPERPVLRVEF